MESKCGGSFSASKRSLAAALPQSLFWSPQSICLRNIRLFMASISYIASIALPGYFDMSLYKTLVILNGYSHIQKRFPPLDTENYLFYQIKFDELSPRLFTTFEGIQDNTRSIWQ
ncbi:hypothetical protein VTN00DRAFT_9631 [Thermoascus crustaceus]|uniref:uncharacterized protein n=1 Tax=Thermoascus crustaceus TaxID=5088 RepID=UPI0037437B0A